ncbi:MAG: preprotein translocase subunit SecA, partial [Verrucomicrobiae bacterium]|nr:preprotein translocase subunit SecA [Verrucomicrobiae bacterium]
LPVFAIPTHRPCLRETLGSEYFLTAEQKRNAIAEVVAEAHARRQPVLIGTRSVAESELLAHHLEARELPCRVLNASRHRHEAAIVAEAGYRGSITIATNMAGRGTDIKLSRNVDSLGGLLVIISELHTSSRIDRQLAGRCARQGEPGQVRQFASFEDDLARRFIPKWAQTLGRSTLASRFIFSKWLISHLFQWAQHRAKSQAFRERKQVPQRDEWLSESLAFAGKDSGN